MEVLVRWGFGDSMVASWVLTLLLGCPARPRSSKLGFGLLVASSEDCCCLELAEPLVVRVVVVLEILGNQ